MRSVAWCRIRLAWRKYCACNFEIICYNEFIEAIATEWLASESVKTFPDRSKYREGFYYFNDKSNK